MAKSHTDMMDWMKILSVHTILHAENELINQVALLLVTLCIHLEQAEEMIAKATLDQYIRDEQPFESEEEKAT